MLDIPSSARPAAPACSTPCRCCAGRRRRSPTSRSRGAQIRRSGVRVWLARPWFSSGDGELLGRPRVRHRRVGARPARTGRGRASPRRQQAPDGATSLWGGGPDRAARRRDDERRPCRRCSRSTSWCSTSSRPARPRASRSVRRSHGEVYGGRDRGWPDAPGNPVAVAGSVPLRDVQRASRGPGPGLSAGVRRGHGPLVRRRRAAGDPRAVAVRAARRRAVPAALDRGLLAVAGGADQLGAAAAHPHAHREPPRSRARPGDADSGVVNWLRCDPHGGPEFPGEQLSADSPTGDAAARASRLQQSRTVRATVQSRSAEAGDLEWEMVSTSVLLAVSVEEAGSFRATWTGSVILPPNAGRLRDAAATRDCAGPVGASRPGGCSSRSTSCWTPTRPCPGCRRTPVPRLVYADTVAL